MRDEYYLLGEWRDYVAEYWNTWAATEQFTLDPETTALLIIDVQRKTCDRNAARGLSRIYQERAPDLAKAYFDRLEQTVIPSIQQLLAFFRQHSLRRFFFTVGPHFPTGEDLPGSFRRLTISRGVHVGSPEYQIVGAVAPQLGEIVFQKVTRSGFVGTGAELVLRNLGVQNVVLVGGATHACVEATGRTAADLGFGVVLVEDGCISQMPLLHEATLIKFSCSLGRILSAQEVIEELQRKLGPKAGATDVKDAVRGHP